MQDADFDRAMSLDSLEFSSALSDMADSWQSNASFDQMAHLIHCVCQASRRCQVSQYYIQAVQLVQGVCLTTNVVAPKQVEITTISSGWAIGRSSTCAIRIHDTSISRCHSILSHHPENGFFITDLGSRNGSWVNGRRLDKMQRHLLRDGDLLKIGKVSVEFFMADCEAAAIARSYEETYS